jgi:hypothetical protein
MTSVPLAFPPENLSSLFSVGIVILLLLGAFDVIAINLVSILILIMIIGIIIDQLILGPLWYMLKRRDSY